MADWQKGDLALCVDTAKRGRFAANFIEKGRIYTVVRPYVDGDGDHVLALVGCPCSYFSDRFRKITPGAKIEGIEEPRRVKVDV